MAARSLPLSVFLPAFLALAASGCVPGGSAKPISGTTTTSAITALTTPAPAGPKAVRILFKQATTGSFDAPPAGGTPVGVGNGLAAVRVFNADGTLLADKNNSATTSSWPTWLKNVEIGVSGPSNPSATNADCARFAGTTESTAQCSFSNQPIAGVVQSTNCGAPAAQFRVSEYDCQQGTVTDGNGGAGDGVYIRVGLCRDTGTCLGTQENLTAVLEYAASGLSAPSDPTACLSGGALTPEACADLNWKIFLKGDPASVTSPFLMLVPPLMASVNTSYPPNVGTGGSGTTTRQFVLPIAADPSIKTIQISRIKSTISNPGMFSQVCAPGGAPANSPYCVGMVFVGLTLYRM